MNHRRPFRRWLRVFLPDARAEVAEELEQHIDERAREYEASGLDPAAARAAALARMGDLARVQEQCTDLLEAQRKSVGRRTMLRVSWIDVKLGLRILVKYPGLTLVTGLGLALAIGLGAGWFGFLQATLTSKLPLADGERVVSLRNRDVSFVPELDDIDFSGDNYDRQSLHDFFVWRDELHAVRDLSAFRTDTRNLLMDGAVDLVRVAEMTASGFRVARVPAELGRTLLDEDELPSATPALVIAHEEWQKRFAGDPRIIGRTVRLGSVVHTIVGVMPVRFGFPFNHRFWVPFHLNADDYERGRAPAVNVFGRLQDGTSIEQVQAQLSTIGARMSKSLPESHAHLRPFVLPYAYGFLGFDTSGKSLTVYLVQNIYVLLLLLVSMNVGILVYARTATRTSEIAVRSALGASRRRVVLQLFVEALVLTLSAAAVGLPLAAFGIKRVQTMQERGGNVLPFWVHMHLSGELVLYVLALAVLAAVLVGVLPALKATGRRLQAELQLFATRGAPMQLGRTWTALIIMQVAIAVAVLPGAIYFASQSLLDGTRDLGYPAEEFVHAQLSLEGSELSDRPADHDRFVARVQELRLRLQAEPGVKAVTFASRFPGNEGGAGIEIEGLKEATPEWAALNEVAIDWFPTFDIPILAGRGFGTADANVGANTIIINRELAQRIAPSGSALGRRLRYITTVDGDREKRVAGPWLEIVGVVRNFPLPPFWLGPAERVYRATRLAIAGDVNLAVRLNRSSAPSFPKRFLEIAAAVDPELQLQNLRSVAVERRQEGRGMRAMALAVAGVTSSVLLLVAAGIYALMSFTVTRRRREIGIRTALGADARRILTGVFARATLQISAGVLIGLSAALLLNGSGGEFMGDQGPILLPLVAVLMWTVGVLAAVGPARRGLAIQPTEALRAE